MGCDRVTVGQALYHVFELQCHSRGIVSTEDGDFPSTSGLDGPWNGMATCPNCHTAVKDLFMAYISLMRLSEVSSRLLQGLGEGSRAFAKKIQGVHEAGGTQIKTEDENEDDFNSSMSKECNVQNGE